MKIREIKAAEGVRKREEGRDTERKEKKMNTGLNLLLQNHPLIGHKFLKQKKKITDALLEILLDAIAKADRMQVRRLGW